MIELQDKAPTIAAGHTGKSNAVAGKEKGRQETAEERVQRLYKAQGGPLIGWLFDEARSRCQNGKKMSAELGVKYGYISQLRSGIRNTAYISQEMADACAKYLGVPAVVVKLLAGNLRISDFVFSHETEEQMLDRAIRRVQEDPQIRSSLPHDLLQLPLSAKRAMVLIYAEVAGQDVFGHKELPSMVRLLQGAAMFHDENESAVFEEYRAIV